MRKIGEAATSEQAAGLSDYLYAKGIDNTMEAQGEDVFEIWIKDEDSMMPAREAISRYLADPGAPEFAAAREEGSVRRRKARRQEAEQAKRIKGRGWVFQRGMLSGIPVTRVLILLSVLATVFGGLGENTRVTQMLSITEYAYADGSLDYDASLPEIAAGQVWRLITPVFLHASLGIGFGFVHLLFNMLWLRDLGGMIEKSQGLWGLLAKVLAIGIFSNLAQFFTGSPAFGGMSGVVFGLLGYAWLRGRLDLTSGLYVANQTMTVMGIWFVLCLTGAMGPIANAAHVGGLIAGLAWGWLAAWRVNTRR